MKILHAVESYYPSIGGMQEVVRQLSERMVKAGHTVTVVTSAHPERNFSEWNGVAIRPFSISGNTVRGIKGDEEAYRNFLLNNDFDIITFFAAQQWATDLALPILKNIQARKVFVPTGFSSLFHPTYRDYYEKMKSFMKDFDSNVFLSDNYRDIRFARENNIFKTILIPNGAGADEFLAESRINLRKKFNIAPDEFLVLHVGGFTGQKGHREVVEIFLRSRIQKGTLLMVSNNKKDFSSEYLKNPSLLWLRILNVFSRKRIIFTSLTREETVAAYKEADLFLFPSNIECSPIVLFEAMAAKTPFLVTDVGNSSEIAAWSGGGKVLPTRVDENGYSHAEINGSVAMLNKLYAEPEKRKRLLVSGFEAWKSRFTWEIITGKYLELYKSLTQST